MSIYEQAKLSQRLRERDVSEWCSFLRLWSAFNCIYGEQTGRDELEKATQAVQRFLSEAVASRILERTRPNADALLTLPPGDMRKDAADPDFRKKTEAHTSKYGNPDLPARDSLAGLVGVIYQVRCNLLHGDKDPDEARDLGLVSHCVGISQVLVPALEEEILM